MTFKQWRFVCATCASDRPVTVLQWDYDPAPSCGTCGNPLVHEVRANKAPGVIGDECDVTVEHGICNPDGSPRRYRSKSEMRAVAKAMGLENIVTHVTLPGTDKSPHTSRWV